MAMTEKALLPAQNGQQSQPTSALAPVRLEAQTIDLMTLCKNLAQSGYFKDARDASQAVVKVLYGQELGIAPVTAMMSIHVIEGKPAPSSNLLASIIKRSGVYNYRVRENTRERCLIAFFEHGEEIGVTEWTIDDARAAGLAGKAVWKSYPRQMLFARCLTEGVRTHCPDLFGGAPVYTAEELGAEVDPETGEPVYREASVPQPVGQTIELPNRTQQQSGPSEKELRNAIKSVLDAINQEWAQQELPEDKQVLADYGNRVLGRAPRKSTEDLAGRLDDFRQILSDLAERPNALKRLCIASQTAEIDTHAEEGERHRRWMASIVGAELPSRKLYTARECQLCTAEAERLAREIARLDAEAGASDAAAAAADAEYQASLTYASDDPFADE